MGRILNTDQYPIKPNPTLSDYVIGTDSEQDGRTVNFPVGSFGDDGNGGSIIQNNRFRLIKTGIATSPSEVSDLINAFKTPVEVLDDEIPLFVCLRPSENGVLREEFWGLNGVGKGTYGLGGDTLVSSIQPFLIEGSEYLSPFNPDDVINSVLVDFGAIGGSDLTTFVNLINNSSDIYEIVAGTNWYFRGNVSGDNVLYGWKGANGTYGSGGTTATITDLFLIEDETGTNTQPSTQPTGLERINEGNGDAWRLIGRDPSTYNNAGLNSVDFSAESPNNGASGELSFNVGSGNDASGFGAITMGASLIGSGILSTTFGFENENRGYGSFIQGYNNLEDSQTGFGMVVGHSNNIGVNAGLSCGVALEQTGGVGTLVAGAANLPVPAANNGSSATNPMIIIGNGSHTTPIGSAWVPTKRSNLLVGLRDGTITLPSTDPAVIDLEPTGKQIVTREWVEAQGFNTESPTGLEAIDEGNGVGWRLIGSDPASFGNIGLHATNLSAQAGASSVSGATGDYSFTCGIANIASGYGCTAIGNSNIASGVQSFVGGFSSEANGATSFAFGTNANANEYGSFAMGSNADANGRESFAMGYYSIAESAQEIALGFSNTTYTPNNTIGFDGADRLLVIGNGANFNNKSDALTILKNGRIGINVSNFEADPRPEYMIIDGSVSIQQLKLTNLPVYADDAAAGAGGLATDFVYKTATGELRIKL